MSNGPPNAPQTPLRYAPGQQTAGQSPYAARPGQPISMVAPVQPTLPRPAMAQFRPTLQPAGQLQPQQLQQQQQQQQMYMANRGPGVAPPYTQQQLMQQQQQMMQQQQQQQQMRNVRPNQMMFVGNSNIAVTGVVPQQPQPHPSLMSSPTPVSNRKRKSKLASETPTAAAPGDESDSGDEATRVQPFTVALARYQQNHNLMAEVFVALPLSTIPEPAHFYEKMDRAKVEREVEMAESELGACERAHGRRLEQVAGGEEFGELIKQMRDAGPGDVDAVKARLEELLGVAFVGDAYRTVERVRVGRVDAVEGAVYGQL